MSTAAGPDSIPVELPDRGVVDSTVHPPLRYGMHDTHFDIDPSVAWVRKHNEEAVRVVDAWERGRPERVPLLCDDYPHVHGFYADEIGLDYRDYYGSPERMFEVQLAAAKRRREIPVYDFVLGAPPESWPLSVDFHPVQLPAWLGCELMYRQGSVIAHKQRNLSREECDALPMPDLETGGLLPDIRRYQSRLTELGAEGEFLGRPVGPVDYFVGSHGLLTTALDLRGPGLLEDMIAHPDFVDRYLRKIVAWVEALTSRWHVWGPEAMEYSDHGIEMISGDHYERFFVPVIKETNRRRGTVPGTELHHCGSATHLFPLIQKHFGITGINALTYPLVDVARIRAELGENVRIQAVIADEIVRLGPPEKIRQTVKEFMGTGVKGSGGLSLSTGDMLRGTPMEHRIALYESVKEFGGYAA